MMSIIKNNTWCKFNSVIKRTKALMMITISCLPAQVLGQSYRVTGDIKGLKDHTKFFLIRSKNGNADTVKTVISNKGRFIFQGKLNDEGELYFIKLDTSSFAIASNKDSWIRLFLENKIIEIKGDANSWPDVKVEGSESTMLLEVLEKKVKLFDEQLKAANNLKDSIGRTAIIELYKKFLDSIVDKNQDLNASASILFFFKRGQLSEEEQFGIYERLSKNVRNSFYAKKWMEEILTSKKRDKLKKGAMLPDFRFKVENGETESIMSVIKQSKFTLIDFWASWCAPCISEWPNLENIYASHNRENFNIIGISVMDEEVRWKQAIVKNKTAWRQGHDWDDSVAKLFNFNSLPAYLLVDQNGRLIAYESTLSGVASFGERIRGENLIHTLNKLIPLKNK
ncbi:redoxin domain-containing protein [Chitinophaga sp. 22620]|uniref:redoxin domain-containing protein n=1 Tax=Chitinophaga sp. 22620 TaxID=3453952 RepID=UPI003F8730EC